jgi:hypothetical protein
MQDSFGVWAAGLAIMCTVALIAVMAFVVVN